MTRIPLDDRSIESAIGGAWGEDEVALLERFQDSRASSPVEMRYNARLTKAQALAARERRTETGALLPCAAS
jgi:hypothetical protein